MADNLPKKLYHYTTDESLKAILKNKTLRSTHFQQLNDSSELKHVKDYLIEELVPTVTEFYKINLQKEELERALADTKLSFEELMRAEADTIIRVHYKVTGKEFYVTSFCSHEESYDLENGLLSQWRGYGNSGGYALIFDKNKLDKLVDKERKSFEYGDLFLDKNYYYLKQSEFGKYFSEELKYLKDYTLETLNLILKKLRTGIDPGAGNAKFVLPSLLRLMSLTKHRAFSEEKEIRIVSWLPFIKEEYRQEAALQDPSYKIRPIKDIEHRTNTRKEDVPFITLFNNSEKELPIEKIIVGPSRDKYERAEKLRNYIKELGLDIEVTVSETPFV